MDPATMSLIIAAAIPTIGLVISEVTGMSRLKSNSIVELGVNLVKAILSGLKRNNL